MMTVAEVNRKEWSSNRHLSISNQHLSTFLISRSSGATMQLTVFANDGDQTYYLEVDASMHLEDLVALISAESGEPPEQITLLYNGQRLADPKKDLSSYGLTSNEEIVQMQSSNSSSVPSSTSPQASGSGGVANDMERMRLTLLGNPEMMAELRRASRTRCFSRQRHGLT
ncbi:hypothetical protein FFLO_01703 [Filobasidium floriforme]|uniref:Ubiquitin-like domain-containing protein n=1 Tax=Filobasidium floriforme TaxID=5210 RepID=A0A8K0JP40_9TREE|nr:uncharacterized protein HD553DRAFT_217643 [Filobasidium floriforme]KAG7562874.1 hypothetical protein FFLO_01703 [Filobasidium floriforme]KAH8086436.1 hypothetical protein HD553DRAFT_217643 [Filobasidium floriforme]